ncbi:hypothetical protein A4D02_18370 [Niastella koreensis]|uniref:Uncharacterized protein n=2 Tax=Niastella koreensis TaxID=354356 RepID=G8T967_NIAKG|nr:hypothetical protein [Niastella koreensis]AEV97020.1 hypothetical protein Niako_0635 [Niastella koreensis GR20-10]OQP39288.1 hypothetical protein A4D02_18370 [Niastella koreensis]
MKRKFLLPGILLFVAIAATATYFLKFAKYHIQNNVSVNCHYLAYACGDCYPRYNVSKVSPASLGKKLLNQDIDIEFASTRQEQEFNRKIVTCAICYNFDLKGDLFYSSKEGCYVLKVASYKLKLNFAKCCTH